MHRFFGGYKIKRSDSCWNTVFTTSRLLSRVKVTPSKEENESIRKKIERILHDKYLIYKKNPEAFISIYSVEAFRCIY